MKPIMLGSPLRCAQSSDSAGLSPQGFLFLLDFDESNLRAQHPQLLEKGTERGQRGDPVSRTWEIPSSLRGHCHLAEGGAC